MLNEIFGAPASQDRTLYFVDRLAVFRSPNKKFAALSSWVRRFSFCLMDSDSLPYMVRELLSEMSRLDAVHPRTRPFELYSHRDPSDGSGMLSVGGPRDKLCFSMSWCRVASCYDFPSPDSPFPDLFLAPAAAGSIPEIPER